MPLLAYHINSALYPVIDLWQRVLRFETAEAPADKLHKLEQMLAQYRLPLAETVPLFAALLSLPDDRYPALALTPQQQKQKTLEALLALLVEHAAGAPAVDCGRPALGGSLDAGVPQPAGGSGANGADVDAVHVPPPVCPALATAGAHRPAHPHPPPPPAGGADGHGGGRGKALPAEVVQQIITKSDGVPLFVEEMTKLVLASGCSGSTRTTTR